MSGEERSPKRQRVGSYSPASPPIAADPKQHSQPHTPPPSVRMSPSWSQQGQTLPGLGSPPNTASSQSFQSQALSNGGSSMAEGEQQTQTPATIVEDAEMRDAGGSEGQGVSMEDAESRPTDHERTDHERKDEARGGVLYKLSTEPIPPLVPAPDIDLMSLYSLKNLQQSVARRDPVTGEKINVLRKSYTNKVKDLGLEGRNKATKSLPELSELVNPGWNRLEADGKTAWQTQRAEALLGEHDTDAMLEALDSAMAGMRPGHLPKTEHARWKDLLGLDEAANAAAAATTKPPPHPSSSVPLAQGSKTGAPNPAFLAKTAPGAALRTSAPASPRNASGPGVASRPDRAGKKRRYDESSYEGYEDDGYDTGGMEDSNRRGSGGGKRQKRKDFPATSTSATSTSPPFTNPATSAVGVRSS